MLKKCVSCLDNTVNSYAIMVECLDIDIDAMFRLMNGDDDSQNIHADDHKDNDNNDDDNTLCTYECTNKACDGTQEDIHLYEGDVMCLSCGSILDRYIDDRAEWRNYQDSTVDQNRCGLPVNELYPQSNLGSVIGFDNYTGHTKKLRRYQCWNSMPYKERNLYNIADHINTKASNGDIPSAIINDAKMMYKQLSSSKISRGNNKSGLIASCIYFSCKSNNVPRSAREIAKMFDLNISVMTKGCKQFHELLKVQADSTSPVHFIHRFCSKLECGDIKDVCMHVINNTSKLNIVNENAPSSIAAACIYMVSSLAKRNITKKKIAEQCDISEVTVNKCYKKLYEYRGDLLPDEFIYEYSVR